MRNPATGQVIGTVAHAGIADLERALAAVQSGFEVWRDASVYERAAVMRRAAALLRERGARVLTGGERVGEAGNFFAPTIISDLTMESALFNEEPFGPIAGVRTFDQLEEAIAEANRLPYGLAAYAFTRSFKNVQLLSNRVETGMLWINQPATPSAELPFGGVKDSGYGTEGGHEALEAYLNTKAVSVVGV
ncbi:aldehyde dehydrogenase family protein [Pusillimonas sp.]|uniref:aldehyde dehydrogenase family protein n=1 Tax=Pusillimonas sp. TaxID=3040095 RepID=UPI0039B8F786